jgi:hypothetical protein
MLGMEVKALHVLNVHTIRHPDIRVKHGSILACTPIAVTLFADVFVYKTESCIKIVS